MKKGFARRMLACLLAMCMMIGLVPTSALAAPYDPTKSQVHVVVENTTYSTEDGAPWDGVLVDTWVDLNEQSTMMNCVVAALDEGDFEQTGAENNYISEINGLGEFDGGWMSGWMGTLNDWFTNEGFGGFTVANGKLGAYDEIRIMYTCNGYGEDLGGSWGNNDTSLKAIEFSAGTLTPVFAAGTTAYTLTVPAGTEAIKITPTAENKNFQVTASVGGTVYKRTQMVPVSAGTVIQIVVGGESMNAGATDTVYTFTVAVEGGEEPQRTESFADVKVRAQAYGAYFMPVDAELHVSNLKAESYGFTDALEGVTALDVMVAAHEAAFGEDFTAETAADYMAVPASGFVGKLFGVETTSNGFLVNGGYPNDGTESDWGGYNGTMVTNTPVVNGDTVEFVIYADPTWLDQCTWVTAPTSVETGAEFEATVLGQYFMMGYNYATPEAFAASAEALEDACLAWIDMATGAVTLIEDAVTDEDGVATITAPEAAGTYYLTAATNEDEEVYVFMNPVAITVTEPAGPVTQATFTFGTTNANTVIAPKLYKAADTEKANDLLDGVAAVDKVYTVEIEEGTYVLETFTADGRSNGTMKIDVTAEEHDFTVFVVQAYCSTSGWVYGTDYELTGLKVMSGGEKATVLREVTIGDYETAGRKSFLVLNGDTYHFYGHPLGDRANTYTDTFKYGTVTGSNYCSASFAMSTKCQTSVTIPYVDTNNDSVNDYVLEFGQMTNYYIYTYNVPSAVTLDAEAQTETYSFETAKGSSTAYFYRVSNPLNADVVTYGNYMTTSKDENAATVTLDQLTVGNDTLNRTTLAQNFEYNNYDVADLYLNINEKGYLNLSAGETFSLYPYRNWLAIEGINNARVIEPDFHVEVINVEGNPITVTEKTADDSSKHSYSIEANAAGTAIVLVTYDAMIHDAAMINPAGNTRFFSAIWPQNTGVFVVSVDAATGFETGMTINEGKNPVTSKLSGDKIDSELDVLYYEGSEGASYTFTPAEGTTVTLAKGSIAGGKLSIGAFGSDGVTVNADGSVTLSGLTAGKHVVKLVNGGKTEYQVIRSMQLSYKMYKGDAADEEQLVYSSESGYVENGPVIHNEDKVTLVFNRVYHPANKLSGIYNMAGSIRMTTEDGTMFGSNANQYLMASNAPSQKVTITVPKFFPGSELPLTGNAISSGFGSPYGSHRILTYEAGKTANFTAGSVGAVFAQFPEIKVPVESAEFLQASFVYTDDAGQPVEASKVTVNMTDVSGNIIPVAQDGTFKGFAETYSYTMSADGYKYNVGSVTLTEDGSNVFNVVLDRATETSWDGVSISEPEKDEEGTFLISNGKEMAWFANEVTANRNVTANAKLIADIDLANYPWTPMGGSSNTTAYAGHFDGNGHEIEELFVNDQAYAALFYCTRNAVIENLTVSGNIRTSKANAGAIVGYAQGQNAANPTVIRNCVSKVNITTSCTSSSLSVGGIAGYAMYVNIINCVNEGTITATAENTSSAQVGGILGYMMNYASVVEGCKNTGAISGINSVGGIVGICGGTSPIIKNSYNTAAISGNDKVGGIIGDAAGSAVTGCYSIGSVSGNSNVGAAIGANGAAASKVFFLNTVANPSGFGIGRDEAGLKGANISEAFIANCEGFPILTWEGEATAHTPEVVEVIEPTCLEEGYTNYKCSNCGLEYSETYVPALGHDPSACVQHLGYREGNCTRCDEPLFIWDDEKLANVTYPQTYLDAISFTDEGAYGWTANAGRLESNNVNVASSSAITTFSVTAPFGGTISFGYGVSSESGWDKFTAEYTAADGTVNKLMDAASGEKTGTFEAELGAGTTTLKLTYTKDSSGNTNQDRAWVENLVITANADPADIAAAAAVDEKIAALTPADELTLENFEDAKEAVEEAREAYDALTEDQKALVTKADELAAVEEKLAELQAEADKIAADQAAAEEMDEQIAELPAAEDIDFSNMKDAKKQVEEARAAYDALTDDQKALVDPEKLAALEAAEAALEELNEKLDEEITLPFKDVKKDAWYYDSVDYVYKTGIMSGMNETTFAPTKTVARAQFATMLYRLAGEPEVTYTAKFADVKDGQWYTDAVMWASEAGVITGYNDGTFGPAKDITREQMATMLYRYETLVKKNTPEIGDPAEVLKNFKDCGRVSAFAKEGLAWAVSQGIITGHEDGADKLLKPVGTACRAEAATIMMRYMK